MVPWERSAVYPPNRPASARYSTFVDNQTAILLNIYQGERELTKDCRPLGTFKLSGIPPMPAQFPQVEVTFLVDQNGMLTVSAKELRSGAATAVTVQPAHGLTPDEVESLVAESVAHASEDFTARRLIELRNKGEADLRHTEKALAVVKKGGIILWHDYAEMDSVSRAVDEYRGRIGDLCALAQTRIAVGFVK